MKALLVALTAAAAVGATASAALAHEGYYYLGGTLPAAVQPAPAQGISIITDTLGGKGQPSADSIAPTSAGEAYSRYATGGQSTMKPYIYGGAPAAVAAAGSGFYRAGLTHASTAVAVSSGSGFDWADAGVGAVTGFGALALLLGGSIVVARRRHVAL